MSLTYLFPVLVPLKTSITTGCKGAYNIKRTLGTMKKNDTVCLPWVLFGSVASSTLLMVSSEEQVGGQHVESP